MEEDKKTEPLKITLRRKFLSQRNQLDSAEVLLSSLRIFKKLISLDIYRQANSLMTYISTDKEVNTRDLINNSLDKGKSVSVPYINSSAHIDFREMHACRIYDIADASARGMFAIPQPSGDNLVIIPPSEIDIVIVPGIMFDREKNRIGFGGGYYDRFLKKVSAKCIKIALCFDFQLIDKIIVEDYDVCMDMIITENRIL